MSEKIGIEVALLGAEAVLGKLREIDAFGNKLDKKKFKMETLDPAVRNVSRAMDKLRADTRSFQRTWKAVNTVDFPKKLASVNGELRKTGKLYGEMYRVQRAYEKGSLKGSDAQIARQRELTAGYKKYIQSLNAYRNMLKNLQDFGSAKNYQKFMGQQAEYMSRLADANREMKRSFNEIPVQGRTLGETYNRVSGTVSRLGASMTTLGNTLTRITSPFESIARGAMYTVGYGMVNKVTQGLASSGSRFDTLTTYPKIMASLGFNSEKAQRSVDKLNESVIGLPTGLDEIVDMAKRYALATGDITKGTDYAIAANNAFLASASTDAQKYQGMMQLNDVMSGKKLQSREWMSLAASMPAAIAEIGKYLGYTDHSKFLQDLYGNKVPNKKFLKALKAVGTEQGKIAKMANISKLTFAGLGSNIKNAFSRGGYKMLKALDDIFQKTTGKGFVENAAQITKGIDSIFTSAEKWVRANPDKMMDAFNKLKSFDWKGLATGFGSGIKDIASIFSSVMKMFGGDASKLGKFMVWGNMIGRAISVFGGFTKGLAPAVGGIAVLSRVFGGGKLARLFSGLKGLAGARGAVQGAETLGKVGTAMKSASLSWQGVASKALSIAAIPAMAGSMWLAAKALQEFDKLNLSWGLVAKIGVAMGAIAAFFAEAAGIGALLSSNPIGWLTTASAAMGGLSMESVAVVMYSIGRGLNSIATAKLPSAEQVRDTMGRTVDVLTALSDAGKEMPPKVLQNLKTFSGIDKAFSSITNVGKVLPKIAKLKITDEQVKAAREALVGKDGNGGIAAAIGGMKEAIASAFGQETYNQKQMGSRGKVKTGRREVFDQKSLDASLAAITSLDSAFGTITGMVTKFQEFGKAFKEAKIDPVAIGGQVESMVNSINGIVERFTMSDRVKNFEKMGDVATGMQSLSSAMDKVKEIIVKAKQLSDTYGKEGGGNLNLSSVIDKMLAGLDADAIFAKLGRLETIGQQFSLATQNIKMAFQNLNAVGNYDTSGFTMAIQSAVTSINSVNVDVSPLVSKLTTAANNIKKAWNKLKTAYNAIKSKSKSIKISVSVDVSDAVQNINAAAAKLRAAGANLRGALASVPSSGGGGGGGGGGRGGKGNAKSSRASTGGYINGKGRPIYRARGGAVMMVPRGTDTVPAMLTKGEYVQRKAAVDYFGPKFMQRLNHLDLEGALMNISSRAARRLMPMGRSIVNHNVTNKTNNAKVNQTIYTSNPNYTFRRANRFVGAL